MFVPLEFVVRKSDCLQCHNPVRFEKIAATFEERIKVMVTDCFDLLEYSGESVLIGFFFGSDSSYGEPGWFINSIRIGSSGTPVEHQSWGVIKAMYR